MQTEKRKVDTEFFKKEYIKKMKKNILIYMKHVINRMYENCY